MPVKTEEERALLYRANNDARVVYRMNQLAALQGDYTAFVELWENYRVVYDWTNYVAGEDGDFLTIEDYYTDGLKDMDGNASASAVHLRHVRRPNR
jgi:hypothetical protein